MPWPRGRRRQAIERWRALRADEDLREPVELPPEMRVRPRRRAPTPRLPVRAVAALDARRRRTIALAALAVGLAAVVGGGFWLNPTYRVRGGQVSGNARVPAETIYDASGLDGAWVFAASRAEAEERIERLDDVHRARVRMTWPARLWIGVEETAPVLLWEGPGATLAVDDVGRAIPPPADITALPRVRDEAGLLSAPGEMLDRAMLEAAVAYGARFGPIAYRRIGGFAVTTAEGAEVRLGTNAALVDQQVRVLEALRAHLASTGAVASVVDLRHPERPSLRLGAGGGES